MPSLTGIVLGLLLVLAACTDGGSSARAPAQHPPPADMAVGPAGSLPGTSRQGRSVASADPTTVVERAEAVQRALAERDFEALARLVHPERGLRFSPYAYVDTTEHVLLQPEAVADLAADTTTRTWGAYDGTGDPIRLSFEAYYDEFIYDRGFGEGRRGAPDERIGRGNTLDNIEEAYGPEATFVEYHVPGTERYEGMDWASLRLVFVPYGGTPHLVGIVHDEWTI